LPHVPETADRETPMLTYYTQLAFRSFRRNPGITALMVLAVALGIAVCIMTLTVYHGMSGNPIWWKSDRLYTVTMDNWDPQNPFYDHPQLPPPELTYKDAQYLLKSDIPTRRVVMFSATGVVGGIGTAPPSGVNVRFTTGDFFPMFEVPFLYGGGWSANADSGAEPVVVLSREENDKLFGGANSVGRTLRWNNHDVRVVGVLDDWAPRPRFYDLNGGNFSQPDDLYLPFRIGIDAEQLNDEETDCWGPQQINNYQDYLASECVWLQMWVELPDAGRRARMQDLMDGYWAEQRKAGRFQRPRNNRLTDVAHWLRDRDVVDNDNRLLVGLSFAFLIVCLINTVGLLLAKFLGGASITGVRRALGASRGQIFVQHLVEVGMIALVGAALGLGLATLGLASMHHMYSAAHLGQHGGYQELMHFDVIGVVWALVLALVATLAAGLYPAWRVGRLPPAVYLKSQ
jgi:putative ABC transport system permease protein